MFHRDNPATAFSAFSGFIVGVTTMTLIVIVFPEDLTCKIPHVDEPCIESIGRLPQIDSPELVSCPPGSEIEYHQWWYHCECPD